MAANAMLMNGIKFRQQQFALQQRAKGIQAQKQQAQAMQGMKVEMQQMREENQKMQQTLNQVRKHADKRSPRCCVLLCALCPTFVLSRVALCLY